MATPDSDLIEQAKAVTRALAEVLVPAMQKVRDAAMTMATIVRDSLGKALEGTLKAVEWVAGKLGGVGRVLMAFVDTALAAVETFGEAIADIAEDYVKPLTSRLSTLFDVDNTLKPLVRALAPFGKAAVAAGAALVSGAKSAADAAIAFGQQMAQFVGLANPAALNIFNRALEDLYGVIGQALVPVFEIVTEVVRLAADTLNTFASTIGDAIATAIKPFIGVLEVLFEVVGQIGQAVGKVMEAAAPAVAALVEAFAEVLKAIQPVIDILVIALGDALVSAMTVVADIITAVTPLILAFAEALDTLIQWLVDAINEARFWSDEDIKIGGGTAKGSSVGKAVKGAGIESVESVLAKAQTSAYSLGTGASAPERTATFTKMIYDVIVGFPEYLKGLPKDISAAIAGAKGKVEKGDFGGAADFVDAIMAAKAFADKAGGGAGAVAP